MLSGSWPRYVLASVVAGVLIAVTVISALDAPVTSEQAVAVAEKVCAGDCASCPAAVAEKCASTDQCSEAQEYATVIVERCVSCVKCVRVAPEAYRMNPTTKKAEIIPGAPPAAIERGARACPTNAVKR